MLADAFDDLGVPVHIAHNATEALRILESHSINLVFTDHAMGEGMTGLDLIADIRERWPQTKAVLATGYMAVAPAGIPLFRKPYDLMETARALVEMARA